MKGLHMKHQLVILQLQFDVSSHLIYISFLNFYIPWQVLVILKVTKLL